ncbi:putative amidoligase enzyme-domain-containing protein, partial [Halenospora varia]
YVFLGAEVVSPPFYYDTKSLDAIERVCEVLSDKYRISCNQSCGLHVHVGNAMKGFDLDMVSKLFGIVFTFELQIDSMHPSHRIRNRQHYPGLRYESKLMKGLVQPEHGKSLLRCALEWILGGARNMDQLVRGMHKPPPRIGGGLEGRMAYNMWNLLVGIGDKKTIEFRQHESTLDPERVVNWIRFCVGLVEYAESVDMRDLKPFLYEHIDHEPADFDIAKVIEALGMPPDLGEFYRE